jgi:alkanesulfonate monooxygenase SsuD/methylene tetrahydromethanopterin reductase-like flavin-dependent oxidoreductase (luciferase family)
MKFGVFDHMDDSGIPLSQQIENRMKLAEAYDRFGFHAYHLAEHHGTPLRRTDRTPFGRKTILRFSLE